MVHLLLCGNEKVFDGALTLLISMMNRTEETVRVFLMTMDLTRLKPDFRAITQQQTDFLDRVAKEKNPVV